jgi:tRNA(adenine34) deaminase
MDDVYFMEKALERARIALDAGEFPVGAVLVHGDRVLAHGRRAGTTGGRPNEVEHAEIGALRSLADLPEAPEPGKMTMYCTMEPCLMCYAALILTGIGRIVYAYEDAMGGGTGCDLTSAGPLYAPRRPEIVPYVLRRKSLALFKAFFEASQNTYWRDSLLADYTLNAAASSPEPDAAKDRPSFSN